MVGTRSRARADTAAKAPPVSKVTATKPVKKVVTKARKAPAAKVKKAPAAKAKKASVPKATPPSKRNSSKTAAPSGPKGKKQATPAVPQGALAPPAAVPQQPAAAAKTPTQPLKAEVVFSFDTTGSMYPCLTQVRRKVKECVERLFEEIGADNLRIGITAHGDYCDKATSYVTKHLPLTTNVNAIVDFVENVQATYGGDAPEAYELVLHEAQNFAWMDGWVHVLVLIGDDQPHGKNDPQNEKHLDWKEELDKLKAKNIVVHGVQALNRQYASSFYAECAKRTGGCHLALHQFSSIIDLVMAVCYREAARPDRLEQYEQEIQGQVGRYSRAVRQMFDNLLGRENVAALPPGDMNAVNPGRFQVLDVDHDVSIKDFVEAQGVVFKKGRGFYEFTKTEMVQSYKEIILMDKNTGDMFEGAYARTLLGLPTNANAKISPENLDYVVFIQSTSYNRKLVGGTRFLYEISDA